jgi:hypothetical protein
MKKTIKCDLIHIDSYLFYDIDLVDVLANIINLITLKEMYCVQDPIHLTILS